MHFLRNYPVQKIEIKGIEEVNKKINDNREAITNRSNNTDLYAKSNNYKKLY
jgi:hypothetical protein